MGMESWDLREGQGEEWMGLIGPARVLGSRRPTASDEVVDWKKNEAGVDGWNARERERGVSNGEGCYSYRVTIQRMNISEGCPHSSLSLLSPRAYCSYALI